jgi:hypothetical protein
MRLRSPGLALTLLAVVVAVLVGGCGAEPAPPPDGTARVAAWNATLADVPQEGFTLGKPDADWTLTIYAAMTEPDAGLLFTDVPALVRRWVAPGDLKVQVRTVSTDPAAAGDGVDTGAAARLMQAAGLQDRFWSVWALLAARNAGFATPQDIQRAIQATPGIDRSTLAEDLQGPRVRKAVDRADQLARGLSAFQVPSYTLARGASAPKEIAGNCVGCLVREVQKTLGSGAPSGADAG